MRPRSILRVNQSARPFVQLPSARLVLALGRGHRLGHGLTQRRIGLQEVTTHQQVDEPSLAGVNSEISSDHDGRGAGLLCLVDFHLGLACLDVDHGEQRCGTETRNVNDDGCRGIGCLTSQISCRI